ncbi:MAG TPA: glycosyltransferase, partial [Planctomycetes bacterium]|nr:glycosyltransferase [Planctomycetota bacterium]
MAPVKVAVTVPTYNEAENIGDLLDALLSLPVEGLHVLVVDDDSPDGTWRIVEERARRDDRIHLLHRKENRGRGLAGKAGFLEALRMGADVVVEMDADFSHHPSHVPDHLRALEGGADVVLGSRAVPGGADLGRPWWRRAVTRAANAYIRLVLGVRVRDCNSGFRCFTREALERA